MPKLLDCHEEESRADKGKPLSLALLDCQSTMVGQ